MDSSEDRPLNVAEPGPASSGRTEDTALPPAFVEVANVSKDFNGVPAVRDVNLRIRRGEVFAILGPSGCGKSTLLRIMAGLEAPSTGDVLLETRSLAGLPPYRRPVNMMFQSYALFPHLTVAQNVAYGLRQDKLDRAVIEDRVDRMLRLVQMEEYRRRKPQQLSGGEQQRVALARSLAKEPKLLLLDEPMGALDRKLRAEMQFEIAEIIRRVRVTCVMVTHDQEEAMVMADRLALMNEGAIVQLGRPAEVYEFPNSRFSAEFLGQVNLFAGQVTSAAEGLLVLDTPDMDCAIKVFSATELPPDSAVSVAVRPERIHLQTAPSEGHNNTSPAVVEDIAYAGSHTTYHLRLPAGGLVTVIESSREQSRTLEHGAQVHIGWEIRDGVLLTA